MADDPRPPRPHPTREDPPVTSPSATVATPHTRARGKLDDQRAAAIVEAVARGWPLDVAASAAGVHRSTLFRWLERGRVVADRLDRDGEAAIPAEAPFLHLVDAVGVARAAAEGRAIDLVLDAAITDARHAEWWLERSAPERWGRRQRTEVVGDDGGPIPIRLDGDGGVALAVAQALALSGGTP